MLTQAHMVFHIQIQIQTKSVAHNGEVSPKLEEIHKQKQRKFHPCPFIFFYPSSIVFVGDLKPTIRI